MPAQPATAKIVKLDASQSLASTSTGRKKASKTDKSQKKRKAGKEDAMDEDGDSDDSGSDVDFVNVELDFFGFIESDYQAVKNLLRQLLSHDAKDLDIAGLADHLIEQEEEVGSTVKSDGEEGDPLAFIGVVPWNADKPYVTSLRSYLLGKTSSKTGLAAVLQDSTKRIAVVLHERLVNMPPQVVPALYRTLDGEMEAAGDAFSFTHLLFVSRVFLASAGDFPEDEASISSLPAKKKKKSKKGGAGISGAPIPSDTYLYHLEDETLAHFAGEGMWTEYAFTNSPERGTMGNNEDFGVEMRGRIALVERSKLNELADATEKLLS